jgi:hypothetical protein
MNPRIKDGGKPSGQRPANAGMRYGLKLALAEFVD